MRKTTSISQLKALATQSRIFGATLESAAEFGGKAVPTVVSECIHFLQSGGSLDLFLRSPSSLKEVEDLKRRYEAGETVDLFVCEKISVALLLITYLQELPEPIIPFLFFDLILHTFRTPNEAVRVTYFQHIIEALPMLSKLILKRILTFFCDLSRLTPDGAAQIHVLCKVVSFSLLKCSDVDVNRRESAQIYACVEWMITNAHSITEFTTSRYQCVVRAIEGNEHVQSFISNYLRFSKGDFLFVVKAMENAKFTRGEFRGIGGIFEVSNVEEFLPFRQRLDTETDSHAAVTAVSSGARVIRVRSAVPTIVHSSNSPNHPLSASISLASSSSSSPSPTPHSTSPSPTPSPSSSQSFPPPTSPRPQPTPGVFSNPPPQSPRTILTSPQVSSSDSALSPLSPSLSSLSSSTSKEMGIALSESSLDAISSTLSLSRRESVSPEMMSALDATSYDPIDEEGGWEGEEMEYWGFCPNCAENYDELCAKADQMRCHLKMIQEKQLDTLRIQMEMENELSRYLQTISTLEGVVAAIQRQKNYN